MSDEEIKGKTKQAEGKIREMAGDITDDRSEQAKGKMEQAEGKIREGVGKTERKAKDE